jgi:hypothetical protein
LTLELDRVVNRLRVLGPERLCRAQESGVVPAAATHQLSQYLADVAAHAVGRPRRELPQLPPQSVIDQLVVTATDLMAEGTAKQWQTATVALAQLRRQL